MYATICYYELTLHKTSYAECYTHTEQNYLIRIILFIVTVQQVTVFSAFVGGMKVLFCIYQTERLINIVDIDFGDKECELSSI